MNLLWTVFTVGVLFICVDYFLHCELSKSGPAQSEEKNAGNPIRSVIYNLLMMDRGVGGGWGVGGVRRKRKDTRYETEKEEFKQTLPKEIMGMRGNFGVEE